MAFGLTENGLVIKRLADIKEELEESYRTTFGQTINLDPRTIEGQQIGIYAERESKVWELLEQIYNSQYPDTSEGVPLDNVSAITGTIRKDPTFSTVVATIIGTAGTTIVAGSIISVNGNSDARFVLNTSVIILSGVNEIQTTTFSAVPTSGSFAFDLDGEETVLLDETTIASEVKTALENLPNVSEVTVTGNFSTGFVIEFINDSGDQPVDLLTIVNNTLDAGGAVTVTQTETQIGKYPQVDGNFTAESTGEVIATSETLTVIETPISGWQSVSNALDAEVGTSEEKDQAFKLRRLEEIAIAGKATKEAIKAAILAIDAVTAAVVFHNIYWLTDTEGRPPKSLDIVVENGDVTEIAEKIYDVIGGGIETIGDVLENVTDSDGFLQPIRFSRPTEVQTWVEVAIVKDADEYPADGDQQVEDAILAYGDGLTIGDDVIVYIQLLCSFSNVPGILDAVVKVATAPIPANGSQTVTAADNGGNLEFSAAAHGLADNNKITFTTTGTLPTGISAGVVYHIVSSTAGTLQVAIERGGDSIIFTNVGTGTHTMNYGGRDDNIIIEPREIAVFDSSRTTVTSS